jgi:hypothetical protein
MISKDEIVIRLSRLEKFFLISYLFEQSNNLHVVILRPNTKHEKYNERVNNDLCVRVEDREGMLMAQTFKPISEWIKLTERAR